MDTILNTFIDTEKLCKAIIGNHYETLQSQVGRKANLGNKEGYYPYIAVSSDVFAKIIEDISANMESIKDKSFIDIGAGNTSICSIMDILGVGKSSGLEYQELYVALDTNWPKKLFKGDLLSHDFKEYDILYSYNPIRDEKLMMKGLKNITKTMKSGAVFYYVNANLSSESILEQGFSSLNSLSGVYKFIKK